MKTEKRKIGDLGEKLAAIWLQKQGYIIIARNYLKKWGELDIVACKEKVLHFVEVKSVKRLHGEGVSDERYEAEENVHHWKLKRLYRVIDIFLENYQLEDAEWQLDVAVVELDDERREGKVRIIEDVG